MFGTSEFIWQMRFHLRLFTLTLFRTSQEPPQAIANTFLRIKGLIVFEICNLYHLFFDEILQNAHENKVMGTASVVLQELTLICLAKSGLSRYC